MKNICISECLAVYRIDRVKNKQQRLNSINTLKRKNEKQKI